MEINDFIQIIEEEIKNIDIKKRENKANAYGIALQDNYAIALRDEFYKLDGEYNALINIKNRLINKNSFETGE